MLKKIHPIKAVADMASDVIIMGILSDACCITVLYTTGSERLVGIYVYLSLSNEGENVVVGRGDGPSVVSVPGVWTDSVVVLCSGVFV